jgi:hypothetical protein
MGMKRDPMAGEHDSAARTSREDDDAERHGLSAARERRDTRAHERDPDAGLHDA